MSKLLIRGARLIDPSIPYGDRVADLLVEEGRIARIGRDLPTEDAEILEAAGLVLAPGLVDLHVHLRDPGQTHKEDLRSGGAAAAAGGVTTLCCMPNTAPTLDNAEIVRDLLARAARDCPVKVLPVAAVTHDLLGEISTDVAALAAAGAVALSDDGRPVVHSGIMKHAMEQAAEHGLTVMSHSEDLTLPGDDPASEAICVAREIALAEQTGCPVHICHVSTAMSVRLLREAKEAGVPVTAETAPHYFTLTSEDVQGDPNYKMNPPLREDADRLAIREALADGTLDVIATDHAPHSPEEKAQPYDRAPNGIIGLETSLALGITALVEEGLLTLPELLYKMSTLPARILGIQAGTLLPGTPADLVLFDPEQRWRVDADKLHSKSRNTPFAGKELVGRVKYTLVNGTTVYADK